MIRIALALAASVAMIVAAIQLSGTSPADPAEVEVTRANAAGFLPDTTARDAAALREAAAALDRLSDQAAEVAAPAIPTAAAETEPSAAVPSSTEALRRALVEAIATGRSDAEIGALIAAARQVPGVDVPERLMTARGQLETARFDPAAATEYVVAPGDTLRGIARTHYDTPEAWMRIVEANASAFARNGQLSVGQTLILPR